MILRQRFFPVGMVFVPVVLLALAGLTGRGQSAGTGQAKAPATEVHLPTPEERAAITAASAAERIRELKLLGIAAMQPPATAYDIGKPGNANYDESKANPYRKLPELLVMKDGRKVKTAADWAQRRKEIEAMFAEDVYGKYPTHIPGVTWKVDSVEETTVAGVAATVKHIGGHVDNSAYPAITVEIDADVVTPVSAKGKKAGDHWSCIAASVPFYAAPGSAGADCAPDRDAREPSGCGEAAAGGRLGICGAHLKHGAGG